jgi:hypothetical protein
LTRLGAIDIIRRCGLKTAMKKERFLRVLRGSFDLASAIRSSRFFEERLFVWLNWANFNDCFSGSQEQN